MNTQTATSRADIDMVNNYIYPVNYRAGMYNDAIQFCFENKQNKNRTCSVMCGNPTGGGPGSFSIEKYNSDLKIFNFLGTYGGFGGAADYLGIFYGWNF